MFVEVPHAGARWSGHAPSRGLRPGPSRRGSGDGFGPGPGVRQCQRRRQAAGRRGAIGARFSPDGKTMYVTGATGLGIYDISAPASPRLLSRLPLPHFENEDVDVGRDTVVITNDPSFTGVGTIYLIDVSDPARRHPLALPTNVPRDRRRDTGNGHIANCIAGCHYLYTTGTRRACRSTTSATSTRPRSSRRSAARRRLHARRQHRLARHRLGHRRGRHVRLRRGDPLNPVLEYRSDPSIANTGGGLPGDDGSGPLDFLHHNLLRTSIDVIDAAPSSPRPSPGSATCSRSPRRTTSSRDARARGRSRPGRSPTQRNSDRTSKLALVDMLDDRAQRAGEPLRPLAGDGQLLGALVRRGRGAARAGLVRPGRALPRRLRPARHPPGRLLRDHRHVLGRVLRADRPGAEIVYALDTPSASTSCASTRRRDAGGLRARPAAGRTRSAFLASPRWGFACQLPTRENLLPPTRSRALGG